MCIFLKFLEHLLSMIVGAKGPCCHQHVAAASIKVTEMLWKGLNTKPPNLRKSQSPGGGGVFWFFLES